jgi:hypothetical protein
MVTGEQLSRILESLERNLLTPIPLCFVLGIVCTRIHGGIKIPKELYLSIAIFLLMSIGFVGGHELAHEYQMHGVSTIWKPALATSSPTTFAALWGHSWRAPISAKPRKHWAISGWRRQRAIMCSMN